jgi:fermentation-respiration switch protein FrsA (DUF1100 family)
VKRFLWNLWDNRGFPWRLARIMLLLVVGLIIFVMTFEDKFIYFPTKYPDGFWDAGSLPSREGEVVPEIEDCSFVTSDGVRLHGWYCTPLRKVKGRLEQLPAEMVLLWFHGNAGNITYRYDMLRAMVTLPVQVFIVDYRGYGKSEGSPSEHGLYIDARAAWDYLTNERRVAPDHIVIFGKSLGGVPAVDLASHVSAAGLIVQSSFTSAGDMAASVLPFLPRVLLHSKMDSLSKIAQVHCRKLFIHSPADEVVPFEFGRRLFEAAPEPKEFYEVKGAPHNSTYIVGGKPYFETLRRFIEACAERRFIGSRLVLD